MKKFRLPPASFKSSQSNLCLIPSWPQFSEYLTINTPDGKISSLILLLLSRFHGPSLFPGPIHSFSSFYNLWWWVKIDVKAFFHWKRSILRVLLYRGQRAWEEKGDSQRETWLLGLKLVNTNPHILIDSKYYLKSALTTHWFKVLPLTELNTNPNIDSNFIVFIFSYLNINPI